MQKSSKTDLLSMGIYVNKMNKQGMILVSGQKSGMKFFKPLTACPDMYKDAKIGRLRFCRLSGLIYLQLNGIIS
jgi:hypothetical protein